MALLAIPSHNHCPCIISHFSFCICTNDLLICSLCHFSALHSIPITHNRIPPSFVRNHGCPPNWNAKGARKLPSKESFLSLANPPSPLYPTVPPPHFSSLLNALSQHLFAQSFVIRTQSRFYSLFACFHFVVFSCPSNLSPIVQIIRMI